MTNYAVPFVLLVSGTFVTYANALHSWGEWYPWTRCSVTCGVGTKTRDRHCVVNGAGPACKGSTRETAQCSKPECQGGAWKPWSPWTECTNSVCHDRVGSKLRWRECKRPGTCSTNVDTESTRCRNPKPCQRNGGWSSWSAWSDCSATCGQGYHFRKRSCNKPRPRYGGGLCPGLSWETTACLAEQPLCYRLARYSPWSDWTTCRKFSDGTCWHRRQRRCEYPSPLLPGSSCNTTGFMAEETCPCPPDA